jgi:hypothetical protein
MVAIPLLYKGDSRMNPKLKFVLCVPLPLVLAVCLLFASLPAISGELLADPTQPVAGEMTVAEQVDLFDETPLVTITKGLPLEGVTVHSGDIVPEAAPGEAVIVVPEGTSQGAIDRMIETGKQTGYKVLIFLHIVDDPSVATATTQ